MFEVEIGGEKVEAEVSFYTAQLYESEFMRDIIQDFFGVQELSLAEDGSDDTLLSIDFTKINWSATTRVLWAAVKTADDRTPSYATWSRGIAGVNMFTVRNALVEQLADCFFRAEVAEPKGGKPGPKGK